MYSVEFLGKTFSIDPVAFSIGSFPVYWYGVLIATGFLAALTVAFRRAQNWKIPTDPMIDVVLLGTVGAIVGARAYYVLTTLNRYHSFAEMLDIRDGGIAIYGALIGALLCGGLACLWRKIKVLNMLDLAAWAFLIGQAVGRWGNFMNQEAFGSNTALPWGMYSNATREYLTSVEQTLASQGVTVDPALPVHPCFLYESIWCLVGFVLLYFLSRRRRFMGETFLQYIIWYGAGRFVIEHFRTDSLMIGPFKISQVVALLCVVFGTVALVVGIVKTRKSKTPALVMQ